MEGDEGDVGGAEALNADAEGAYHDLSVGSLHDERILIL